MYEVSLDSTTTFGLQKIATKYIVHAGSWTV